MEIKLGWFCFGAVTIISMILIINFIETIIKSLVQSKNKKTNRVLKPKELIFDEYWMTLEYKDK